MLMWSDRQEFHWPTLHVNHFNVDGFYKGKKNPSFHFFSSYEICHFISDTCIHDTMQSNTTRAQETRDWLQIKAI